MKALALFLMTFIGINQVVFAGTADLTGLSTDITNIPFKTCVGTGSNPMSEYAGQTVLVTFSRKSIQIVKPDGKKKTYFSASSFCNQDLRNLNVQCSSQVDAVTAGVGGGGSSYSYSKSCNVPIPGVPNRYYLYRLDLTLTLNIQDRGDGSKSAAGWLVCAANDDGFNGLHLRDCK